MSIPGKPRKLTAWRDDIVRDGLVIAAAARLRNSANGNPRWRITFTDGTVAETKPDSMTGLKIENLTARRHGNQPMRVAFGFRDGKIRDIMRSDGTPD
jgi:hypothetical protein